MSFIAQELIYIVQNTAYQSNMLVTYPIHLLANRTNYPCLHIWCLQCIDTIGWQ